MLAATAPFPTCFATDIGIARGLNLAAAISNAVPASFLRRELLKTLERQNTDGWTNCLKKVAAIGKA